MPVLARVLAVWALLAAAVPPASAQETQETVSFPAQGPLRLRASARLPAGTHVRAPASSPGRQDGALGAVLAEGLRGATIDLRGVELLGQPGGAEPDRARGVGLLLRDCEDVTVLGGTLGGFQIPLLAEGCRGLVVEGTRFEAWYAQRLLSTADSTSPGDRLEPLAAEGARVLERYGAAIALVNCTSARVLRCTGRGGQNGVVLVGSRGCAVLDGDFSFLSGWGVAVLASRGTRIARNRLESCARGPGLGAAGVLLGPGSASSVVALNSLVGCGSGLVASDSQGDLLWRNDLSGARDAALALEACRGTRVLENVARAPGAGGFVARGCEDLVVSANQVEGARGAALRLEGCARTLVARNVLAESEIGLELARGAARSREHLVWGNAFWGNDADLMVTRTQALQLSDNVFPSRAGTLFTSSLAPAGEPLAEGEAIEQRLAGLGGWRPTGNVSDTSLAPPAEPPHERVALALHPDLPDLDGSWRAPAPRPPGELVLGSFGPWDPEGGAPRPAERRAGGLLAGVPWDARWFSWSDGPDPRGGGANRETWAALGAAPAVRASVRGWATPWGADESLRAAVGETRFGLLASATLDLPRGRYLLSVTSDDGVRVLLDGRVVLENWTWHPPTRDEVVLDLGPGAHALELEYFQIDGGCALTIDLAPAG